MRMVWSAHHSLQHRRKSMHKGKSPTKTGQHAVKSVLPLKVTSVPRSDALWEPAAANPINVAARTAATEANVPGLTVLVQRDIGTRVGSWQTPSVRRIRGIGA